MLFKIKKQKKYSFIEEGEGHPIVLLHGLMGGLSNFDALMNHFSSRGYKVYAPNLPLLQMSVLNSNVGHMSKFVAQFLQDIVKEPSTLVGNSLGGHMGLIAALNYPELVHSLVLTGSSGLYEKSFGETFPKRGSYEYVRQKAEEVFYRPEVATKEIVEEVYDTVNNSKKAIKILYIARSAIKHNMKSELKNIKIPVCLIWGKQDGVTPPEVAVEFEAGLPNAELFWIDECGHAPMMEHPELFNQFLFDWLDPKVKKEK